MATVCIISVALAGAVLSVMLTVIITEWGEKEEERNGSCNSDRMEQTDR